MIYVNSSNTRPNLVQCGPSLAEIARRRRPRSRTHSPIKTEGSRTRMPNKAEIANNLPNQGRVWPNTDQIRPTSPRLAGSGAQVESTGPNSAAKLAELRPQSAEPARLGQLTSSLARAQPRIVQVHDEFAQEVANTRETFSNVSTESSWPKAGGRNGPIYSSAA